MRGFNFKHIYYIHTASLQNCPLYSSCTVPIWNKPIYVYQTIQHRNQNWVEHSSNFLSWAIFNCPVLWNFLVNCEMMKIIKLSNYSIIIIILFITEGGDFIYIIWHIETYSYCFMKSPWDLFKNCLMDFWRFLNKEFKNVIQMQ